jgi:TatD DNase family protein
MMTDIHSHDPQLKPGQTKVFSLQLHPDTDLEKMLNALPADILVSAGVHPWHASEWTRANISLLETMLLNSRILFLGEIGLDNVCAVPFENQFFVFETQLKLAEKIRKPVLIHCVGHQTELLALKKNFKGIPAWILHGFRGKSPMAEQYVRNGFHLSFGFKYQVEALRQCPIEHLFLESDESIAELSILYQKVADELEMSVPMLEVSISNNMESLCIK